MITAKDLNPPVKVGRNAHKLSKNWQASWILALRGKTHSVWFTQHAIDWNEKHSECDEATQEDWAEHYLDCFEDGDIDALGTEILVLENGLTPENDAKLTAIRLPQAEESLAKDAQRRRVGMI